MDSNLKINSPEMLDNVLKEKKEVELEKLSKEEQIHADHVGLATQAIKMINSAKVDPLVQKVVTLRLLGPILTGNARSHISIALELGVTEHDVVQAEDHGREVLSQLMTHVEPQEVVDKFNSDETVNRAVSNLIAKG